MSVIYFAKQSPSEVLRQQQLIQSDFRVGVNIGARGARQRTFREDEN
jgi:hypothetical protein